MEATAIKCPNCGSSVDPAEAVKGKLVCKSCGSMLELTTGSSGFPIAHLLAIEEDTDYLAKTQAVERLRNKLQALYQTRRAIKQRLDTTFKPPISLGTFFFVVLPLSIIIGLVASAFQEKFSYGCALIPAVIVCVAMWFIYQTSVKQHDQYAIDIVNKYGTTLEAIEKEISEKEALLAKLEADLDSATKSM